MKKTSLWKKIIAAVLLLCIALGALGAYVWNNTPIPKLYLTGDISGMETKSDERIVSFRYRDGREAFEGYIKMKVQGSSSLAYEKKNYTFTFDGSSWSVEASEPAVSLSYRWGNNNTIQYNTNLTKII